MPNRIRDLTGLKFGKLTVLCFKRDANGKAAWECRCDCGEIKIVNGSKLVIGQARSCGCYRTRDFEKRIKSCVIVREDGCWEWMGSRSKGYGVVSIRDFGQILMHRKMYELRVGPIPEGMMVCHKCDFRACVNPEHLFLGTADDNNKDAASKDRTAYGERHPRSKLTVQKAQSIYTKYFSGISTQRELARENGVSLHLVNMVIHRKIWKRATENIKLKGV